MRQLFLPGFIDIKTEAQNVYDVGKVDGYNPLITIKFLEQKFPGNSHYGQNENKDYKTKKTL